MSTLRSVSVSLVFVVCLGSTAIGQSPKSETSPVLKRYDASKMRTSRPGIRSEGPVIDPKGYSADKLIKGTFGSNPTVKLKNVNSSAVKLKNQPSR